MNRLFGGGKNKGPSATNLQAQKSKQVESLRKVGAIEILRDVEYRVVLPQGGINLTIFINLPVQFPSEKPIIAIQPAVTHSWVDAQMKVVGCPNVNNFSMHSDLGLAVQAIIEEFKKNPPACVPQHYILGSNNPTVESNVPTMNGPPQVVPTYANLPPPYPAVPGAGLVPQQQPPGFPANPPPLPPRRAMADGTVSQDPGNASVPVFSMPNILSEFPALKDMKLMELQELVEDDNQITEMIQKIPDLANFAQQRENLSAVCVQLAHSNLSKKPDIEQLRENVNEKNAELEKLKQEFEAGSERHMVLSDQYHPSNIQTNLKVAVMEADEESENIAESFLNQKMDIDEFMKTFVEKRTLCHLRRAKEEKLNHIIMSRGLQY